MLGSSRIGCGRDREVLDDLAHDATNVEHSAPKRHGCVLLSRDSSRSAGSERRWEEPIYPKELQHRLRIQSGNHQIIVAARCPASNRKQRRRQEIRDHRPKQITS
jgi:hypothetical protein